MAENIRDQHNLHLCTHVAKENNLIVRFSVSGLTLEPKIFWIYEVSWWNFKEKRSAFDIYTQVWERVQYQKLSCRLLYSDFGVDRAHC